MSSAENVPKALSVKEIKRNIIEPRHIEKCFLRVCEQRIPRSKSLSLRSDKVLYCPPTESLDNVD